MTTTSDSINLEYQALLYERGWRRGASFQPMDEPTADDPDYQDGYHDGNLAYQAASDFYRRKIGLKQSDLLRIEDKTDEGPPVLDPSGESFKAES